MNSFADFELVYLLSVVPGDEYILVILRPYRPLCLKFFERVGFPIFKILVLPFFPLRPLTVITCVTISLSNSKSWFFPIPVADWNLVW